MPWARKARILPRKSRVLRASVTLARAATFWEGAQPSSRSKITSSASPAAALAIIFRECAGQASSLRRATARSTKSEFGIHELLALPSLKKLRERSSKQRCREPGGVLILSTRDHKLCCAAE